MTTFITEQSANHWTAWDESNPGTAFGGDTAAVALGRLVDSLGISHDDVEAGEDQRADRMTFVMKQAVCPDCGGSGEYVGLNSVEVCRACDGSGQLQGKEARWK